MKKAKKANRYNVQTRNAPIGIVRDKEFDWKKVNIERDINRIKEKGGKHTFLTGMMSEEKAGSFHRAICSRARRIIGNGTDGTKRWRTERDMVNKTITLFVKKEV